MSENRTYQKQNIKTVNFIVSEVTKTPKGLMKISVKGTIPTFEESQIIKNKGGFLVQRKNQEGLKYWTQDKKRAIQIKKSVFDCIKPSLRIYLGLRAIQGDVLN